MPLRKGQKVFEQNTKQAARCLLDAASMLKPDHATLSNFGKAAASLNDATSHIDRATANAEQDPSTTIILRTAANAAATAQDHLTQAHQEIEDAYIEHQSAISPPTIKNILQKAASEALNETSNALELMQKAGAVPQPSFIPPGMVQASRNKAVLAITITAILIAAGLAAHDIRTFAIFAAVTAFISQQSTMAWALISSNQSTCSTRRTDFYATLAAIFTILLIICLLTTGLTPRAAIQITGMAFLLVVIEWTVARAFASHSQKQHSANQR